MSNGKTILGLVGSPRTNGLTNQLVISALEGAVRAGTTTELVQMSEYVVDACKDCLPWICIDKLKCTYKLKDGKWLRNQTLQKSSRSKGRV
ncbi:MAG: NAD(P)H-dependent oxidoreductase [bacterium]|nr:NAD(P)H-dependent oxidoreductase [bacterium]